MPHKRVQDVLAYACLLNVFTFYSFFLPGMLLTEFNKSLPSSFLFSMTSFLIGFIVRPIGAISLGIVADHNSRMKGLRVSVIMVGLSSLLVCLIPDSEHWSYYVLRVVQGFALGGCYPILGVLIYELSPPGYRGVYTGVFQTSVPAGYLLAIAVTILSRLIIGEESFLQHGWRIAFIYSGTIFPIWWQLSKALKLAGVDAVEKRKPTSPRNWTADEKTLVAFTILLATAIGSISITGVNVKGFFLKSMLQLEPITVNHVIAYSTIFYAPTYALWGALADRVGPLRVTTWGLIAGLVFIIPLFKLFELFTLAGPIYPFSQVWFLLFLTSIAVSTIATACFGPFVMLVCDLVHKEHRCTLYGLAYNISTGMIGGTAYLVSFNIHEKYRSIYGGIFYIIGVSMLFGLIALLYYLKHKDTFKSKSIIK